MKAIKLIKHLEQMIEKHGQDIEVFVEAPGFNCETSYSTKDEILTYVSVESLSEYKKELIYEYHGEEGDVEGPGLVYAVVLVGDEEVDHCG